MRINPLSPSEAQDLGSTVEAFNAASIRTSELRGKLEHMRERERSMGLDSVAGELLEEQLRIEAGRDQVHAELEDFVRGAIVLPATPGNLSVLPAVAAIPWIVGGLSAAGVALWSWISSVKTQEQKVENREKELELIEEGKNPNAPPPERSLVEKTFGLSGGQIALATVATFLGIAWIRNQGRSR